MRFRYAFPRGNVRRKWRICVQRIGASRRPVTIRAEWHRMNTTVDRAVSCTKLKFLHASDGGTENGGGLFICYGGASVYPRGGRRQGGEEARWGRRWSMVSMMSALGRNETTLFRRTASTPPDSLTLASATFFPACISTPCPHKGAFSWESGNWKEFVFILAIKSLKIHRQKAWYVERFARIIQLIMSSRCYILYSINSTTVFFCAQLL